MISGIKLKIVVTLLVAFLISASAYYYLETKKGFDNSNMGGNSNETKKEMTALEALRLAEEQMDIKYQKYNLSIMEAFWDRPGYADSFVFYFVINNDTNIIHQTVSVWLNGSNWTVSTEKTYSTTTPSPHWWFYTDTWGFDPKIVKIDSDKAVEIMERVAEKENITGSLYLRLENNYLLSSTPTWFGAYPQSNISFIIKVNAVTGDVIDSYHDKSSENNIHIENISHTFNGSNFTAMKGLELSNYYMSLKYNKFNLSEIDGTTADGYKNLWKYHYVVFDPIREFVWETITVYANGTLSSETINLEIEEYLTLHGIRDVWGFDTDLLKIDSNEAVNIINNYAKNESWYESTTYFMLKFEEKHDPQYYSITPEWIGDFVANGKSYTIIINVTTGDIIKDNLTRSLRVLEINPVESNKEIYAADADGTVIEGEFISWTTSEDTTNNYVQYRLNGNSDWSEIQDDKEPVRSHWVLIEFSASNEHTYSVHSTTGNSQSLAGPEMGFRSLSDSDGDGLHDAEEDYGWKVYVDLNGDRDTNDSYEDYHIASDRSKPDTDGDGLLDGEDLGHLWVIICVGWRTDHAGFNQFQNQATTLYNGLIDHGLTDDDIFFLSDPDLGLSYTGVDASSTRSHFLYAVGSWLQNPLKDAAHRLDSDDRVFIYLIDHGYDNGFSLGTDRTTPYDLNEGITNIESMCHPDAVYIVVDTCDSGVFIPSLSSPNRIVITSTLSNQAGDLVSEPRFSNTFIPRLLTGISIGSAFEDATRPCKEMSPRQTPFIDDNGDGVGHEARKGDDGQYHLPFGGDGDLALNTYLFREG